MPYVMGASVPPPLSIHLSLSLLLSTPRRTEETALRGGLKFIGILENGFTDSRVT